MAAALQVCEAVLQGVDEDLLQYIASTVVDEESGKVLPQEELVELVVPMLEELCEGDESQAEALANTLWQQLCVEHGGAEQQQEEEGFRRLETAVRMGGEEQPEEQVDEEVDHGYGVKSAKQEQRSAKQAAKEQEKRDAQIRKKQEEMAQLMRELDEARKEAATELIKKGQSGRLGTLEVGPFTLPNPGGGADLLEDAAMTLVPGHRYGLICRNG